MGTFDHAFVEPVAPPPPTENARAGTDEARDPHIPHDWDGEQSSVCWCGQYNYHPIHGKTARACYAAGRARGIEEERKRCEDKIKPFIGKLHTLCLDFDARALDDVKHAIWNAVTGEGQ